jgi:molecular chaperone GrpE
LQQQEEGEKVQPKRRKEHEDRDIEITGDDASGESETGKPKKTRGGKLTNKELEREVEGLSEELERVSAELDETKDKFLRGLADFDNYRKRVAREREQLVRCANEDLIKRMLDVVDNLERALAAASETHDLDAFKKGVELIYEHLKEVLTKEGLCPISCLGETFDPNFHEAVMAIEKEGEESEKVIEEIQKGYTLDGRVIRPSKVVVSK